MKSIPRLVVKSACLAALLGLASCAMQPALPPGPAGDHPEKELAARVAAKPVPAVLFVGNSYSFGVPKAFSKLCTARGKSVRVGQATHSGWTLAKHAANEATLREIRDGRWDIVVLQEHSGIPAMPPHKRAAAMFPPLRRLVTEARSHGAIPLLYQTWGRRDGDKRLRHDDFHAMTARVRAGYRAAAANAGNLVVAPAGDAWEKEFSTGRGGRLFVADGSHPSAAGNAVTAEAFYQTIFGD